MSMTKIKGAALREELRAGAGKALALPPRARIDLTAQNVRLVDQNSPFFGMFEPDDYSAFVEFDLCHSLPVIAGPAYHTGNYTCWHPAALEKSHRTLLFKQTNLHHFIRSYAPEEISRDRIVGAVVMTSFPAAPDGGWVIPDSKEAAIPIHCCATVFKQAEGALEMLRDHTTGRQNWSVSVEMAGRSYEEMGIYFTQQNRLISFLEAPDDVLEAAVTKDECGCILLGKFQSEQLALCYGGKDGSFIGRGVGFTPSPAEKEAHLTKVSLSASAGPTADSSFGEDYETEEKPGGIMAMCASSAHVALATAAVASHFKGASLVKVITEGNAKLPGQFWHLAASAAKPVVEVKLRNGGTVLRYLGELTK
jgi:hypothetical protein